ncbi:MAG: endolytic transglycosylase MltG [bacterium]|nr:endolytic transglycosylase MltG [bacterium]
MRFAKKYAYILGAMFLPVFVALLLSFPPSGFPADASVSIPAGATINEVAQDLRERNLISSHLLFRAGIAFAAPQSGVVAGEYTFTKPVSLLNIIQTLTDPTGAGHAIRLTVPEGLSNWEIAELARQKLGENFDMNRFLRAADAHEGYLFPETYFIPRNIDEAHLVALMRNTFNERILSLGEEIAGSGRPLSDLVVMASILEGEAYTKKSMQRVAGVLWHRIEINMPLQVDATFKYFLGRTTFGLTRADLKTESPYNTYENKGLPPTAINNPGLAAISAAATPVETDELFYLTGNDGNFYFAKTFDDHKRNKYRYLR